MMNYAELKETLDNLSRATANLEDLYIESDGEVTEEAEAVEAEISDLRTLLTSDGADLLGRWLKAKEDRKKALKAEKDYVSRQIAAVDKTIDFIKGKINEVLAAIGEEKVTGNLGYSFAVATSVKTSVDKDILNEAYLDKVKAAVADILPDDVTITLGASVSKLDEGSDLPSYYNRVISPSVRFIKPKANKED